MVATKTDLWSLVWGKPEIDPQDLAAAIQEQVASNQLDYRTRLLIRDSVQALQSYWGPARLADWLARSPYPDRIQAICGEEFDKVGFTAIKERLMEKTDPEVVRQLLRELSLRLHKPLKLLIGGSIALIVRGYLARATADIDVVDEVPQELRSQHQLLADLQKRYGLLLAHFPSHYLPSGWQNRLKYFDGFGPLEVYLIDVYDIFLGKLTSVRTKDLDDLRMLVPQLDKDLIVQRLRDSMASTFAAAELRQRAEQNWYILFGESLPQ